MITIPEIPDIANKIILDPAGGLGESLSVMLKRGADPKNIYYNDDRNLMARLFRTKNKKQNLGIPEENITDGNFLEWEPDLKFDVIIKNPPYEGLKALHQQFFNKSVDMIKDGGSIVSIQPDSAYVSKKKNQKAPNAKMQDNIKKYKTEVKFVPGSIFKGAAIATGLAITHLTKIEDDQISVEYINGDKYDHIDLEQINKLGVEPTLYKSLFSKFDSYISKNGNITNIVSFNNEGELCYGVSEIRGNPENDDFYGIVMRDSKKHNVGDHRFGFKILQGQEESLYSYVTSFIARFGLSLHKTTTNTNRSMAMIPLVPFDRIWTDEMLMREIGINDAEMAEIYNKLPDYYGLLK